VIQLLQPLARPKKTAPPADMSGSGADEAAGDPQEGGGIEARPSRSPSRSRLRRRCGGCCR